MDGTEDDVLWEDELGEDASEDGESDDDLDYADEELRRVFNETDDEEEFYGF